MNYINCYINIYKPFDILTVHGGSDMISSIYIDADTWQIFDETGLLAAHTDCLY